MSEPSFMWGDLEVLDKIGEGAFGEVFRAHDAMLKRDVALKLRKPDVAGGGAVLDEARHFARVRHPNVLSVFGVDRHEGRVGFWMELVEGTTLDDLIAESGPLGANEAAVIALDVCRALAAVHGSGLIHGDVKPANVMRERGGRIVLMDFGTATPSETGRRRTGTPAAMAPELLRGEPSTMSSDIYAVGALLYFLTTGAYPLEMESLDAPEPVMRPLADRRPDLPPEFLRLVGRVLHERPADRPATAGALAAELGAYLDLARPRPRRRLLFAIPALAVVILALALVPTLGGPRVDATLFRVAGGRSEPLARGARVEPGDQLFLDLDSDRAIHVYVLNEDDRGDIFVLFPLPDLDLRNPVGVGRHRLPGTLRGESFDWRVTSSGGRERFLVAAAEAPVTKLEEVIRSLDVASPDRRIDLGATLRGVGGLARSNAPRPVLEDLAATLTRDGVELRRFEVESGAP